MNLNIYKIVILFSLTIILFSFIADLAFAGVCQSRNIDIYSSLSPENKAADNLNCLRRSSEQGYPRARCYLGLSGEGRGTGGLHHLPH